MHAILPFIASAVPLAAAAAGHHGGHLKYPHHLDRYRREVVNGVVVPLHEGSAAMGAVGESSAQVVKGSTAGTASQVGSSQSDPLAATHGKANTTSSSGSSSSSGSTGGKCFPNGGATLPSNGKAPSTNVKDWWCGPEKTYGFLGFSHALESNDCNDPSNQKGTLTKTFADMKKNYGASYIRIYAPECRQQSFWEGVLEAAASNNMAVIPQIWWGFEDQNLWKQSQAQLESIAASNPLAPYVFHSIAFGSEPIGDGVDNGPDQFVADLKTFRSKINKAGIKVAISEDWDRTGILTNDKFGTLTQLGQSIKASTDMVQAHIMPYYHETVVPQVQGSFAYFQNYIGFLNKQVKQQIFITESPWASSTATYHGRGGANEDENLSSFNFYWTNAYGSKSSCQFFKKNQVGWFMHTYSSEFETGFGLLGDSGSPIIKFKPATC